MVQKLDLGMQPAVLIIQSITRCLILLIGIINLILLQIKKCLVMNG